MQKLFALTIVFLAVASAHIAVRVAAHPQASSWQKISVPTTSSFRGLSAVSASIAWASGTNGTIIRTTDGGATWSVRTVAGAEKLDFRGIRAFDVNTAVIMSSGNAEDGQARIYRTTDGGENWKLVFEQKTRGVFFDAIAFWDRDRGIVVSDPVDGHFALFTTEDGGATWKQIPQESIPAALSNEGAFAASNSCLTVEGTSNVWFVTGGASVARVFQSHDGGESWQVSETPMRPGNASSGLFSMAFRDAKNGIAVGGDYAHPSDSPGPVILLTADGGTTWNAGPATDPPGLFLSSVIYRPAPPGAKSKDAELVAAGTGGINSLHANGKWVRQSVQNINAIAFQVHNTGWAVGPKGTVLRTSE